MRADRWYVLTGGPSSGKTTLIEELRSRGHAVVPESAREVIETQRKSGKTVAEIRGDEKSFQEAVFREKQHAHAAVQIGDPTFFDRGYHDTLAYLEQYKDEVLNEIKKICDGFRYDKVFLLDMLDYVVDEARTESQELAVDLHEALKQVYIRTGHDVVRVPVLPVRERADYILDRI